LAIDPMAEAWLITDKLAVELDPRESQIKLISTPHDSIYIPSNKSSAHILSQHTGQSRYRS
jgi:hypothetical protein